MQLSEAVWKRCSPLAQVSKHHALPLFLEMGNRNSPVPPWGLDNNFMPLFRVLQRPKQPPHSLDLTQLLCDPCFPFPPENAELEPKFSTPEHSETFLDFYLLRNNAGYCEGGIDRILFLKCAPENPILVDNHWILCMPFLRHSYLE